MTPLEQTLAERGTRYGDFSSHARIAQDLQDVMRRTNGWSRLRPMHKQALTTIADKIARILNGDPDYTDNWHDIQGYAKLVEDRLSKPRDEPPKTLFEVDVNGLSYGDWQNLPRAQAFAPRKNGKSIFRTYAEAAMRAAERSGKIQNDLPHAHFDETNYGSIAVDPRTDAPHDWAANLAPEHPSRGFKRP